MLVLHHPPIYSRGDRLLVTDGPVELSVQVQDLTPNEPHGGTLVSQIKRSRLNDWFCGCK